MLLRVDDASISKRLKPNQFLLSDAMDVEQVEDSATVLIGYEKAVMESKGKSKICCDKKREDPVKEGNSVSIAGSEDSNHPFKISTSASINSNNINSSNSELSYLDEDEDCDEDCDDYADDVSDYGDNDDFLYEDDYSIMQSHFDNVDLPPGVEASIPWLKDSAPTGNLPPSLGVSTAPGLPESKKATESNLVDSQLQLASTNTSTVPSESGSDLKEGNEHGDMQKFHSFKHFDVVDDFSDHHYNNMNVSGEQPKEWAKRIQEWKILEKDLPVCLSLLGTWPGDQNEMWVPGRSTMLQVLVSIQALILNARPFFNESGYETSYKGSEGDMQSRKYNEQTFILSLKTMIYTLRRPPMHFEDFVTGHFRNRAHDILAACQAYKEGAVVGSVVVKDGVSDANKIENGSSRGFKGTIAKMINAVAKEFVKNGAKNCEQFKACTS